MFREKLFIINRKKINILKTRLKALFKIHTGNETRNAEITFLETRNGEVRVCVYIYISPCKVKNYYYVRYKFIYDRRKSTGRNRKTFI